MRGASGCGGGVQRLQTGDGATVEMALARGGPFHRKQKSKIGDCILEECSA